MCGGKITTKALLALLMLTVFAANGGAESSSPCDSVVRKVSLESTTGLTTEHQVSLRNLLMGRCFQREHGDVLSEAVYNQLRGWGYEKSIVYDPSALRILDDRIRPSPVAVTIDFCLDGSDRSRPRK